MDNDDAPVLSDITLYPLKTLLEELYRRSDYIVCGLVTTSENNKQEFSYAFKGETREIQSLFTLIDAQLLTAEIIKKKN